MLTSTRCCTFLFCWIFLSWFPGFLFSSVVTLDSIQIFTTHEWFKSKPTVYFQCKGENKTVLPDVKEPDVLYNFRGEESWQPLTDLPSTKCKRCGFYEEDTLKSDDIFDEWEFCSSDFMTNGKYLHFKEKELNVSFRCPECKPNPAASNAISPHHNKEKGMNVALVIGISVMVSTVVIIAVAVGYKYWQRRKRQQDQARFLKLFEDGDDIEDELGLGTVI